MYQQQVFDVGPSTQQSPSPVVGILAQPYQKSSSNEMYIAASYVKWLEAGGARSIPIPYDVTDSALLDEMFDQIDALFLPGGATPKRSFAVDYMLGKAVRSNQESTFFPVWGTCLGMEYLVQYMGADDNILQQGFTSENVSLSLESVVPVGLYKENRIYSIVTNQNVTLNNHHLGLSPISFFENLHLKQVWQMTSLNRDSAGQLFISTLEPIGEFPFYAVQYHPEKNAFEYATYPNTDIPYEAIDHSEDAVDFSMTMARFVVDLARKTTGHVYSGRLPYVYTYPQEVGLGFEQVYIIPASTEQNDRPGTLRSPQRAEPLVSIE